MIVLHDFFVHGTIGTQSCWNRRTRRSRFTATGTPRTTTWRRGTRGKRLETAERTKSMTLPNGRRHWRQTKVTWRGWRGTRASKSVWIPFSVSLRLYFIPITKKTWYGVIRSCFILSTRSTLPYRAILNLDYNYLDYNCKYLKFFVNK